jgi:hypothetical protein
MNMPDAGIEWPPVARSAWVFSEALAEFLRLKSSTTFFLESRSAYDSGVEVEVLQQVCEHRAAEGGAVLRRMSRLYLHTPEHALLVADATIFLSNLPQSYHSALIAGQIGIGKVLDPDNLGLIEKQDVETQIVSAPAALRTRCDWAVSRLYRLRFNGVCCAEIREMCNDESLARLGASEAILCRAMAPPSQILERSQSTIRMAGDTVAVSVLLARGRELWQFHRPRRLPALMGIDDLDRLAMLLAALADDRDVVLCPPDARMPAGCDARIGARGDIGDAGHAAEAPPSNVATATLGGFAVLSSGTLGTPKLIWHRAGRLLATAAAVMERLELIAGERVLITVPVHHLYGLGAALMPALLADAEIQLLPRANVLNFNDALRTFEPQRVYSTPHLMRALLHRKQTPSPYCRSLVLAGDGVPANLHAQAAKIFHRVHNLYGSSELGVIAISAANAPQALSPLPGVAAFAAEPDAERSNLHILHPFPATHIDSDGAVFSLTQPWDTRDIASFAADGTFVLHGRADLSLNRAGKLVILGELEQAAMDWPGVALAVAVPLDEIAAAGQAIALVVKSADASLTLDALKAHASRSLPMFARPDHYRIVADLPCLSNGKPDRSAIYKEYRHGEE